MGKALHTRLRAVYETWGAEQDDPALIETIHAMSGQLGKEKTAPGTGKRLSREDLELICYEYLSS